MPTLTLERKNIGSKLYPDIDLQWKVVDEDQGIIKGYLSVFNNVDSQKDRVRPGAFKKTITEGLQRKANKGKKFLFPMLWMHDPEKPIGGFIDAIEDKTGLLVTAQVDITTNEQGIPLNPLAMSVFSGLKMGYADEMSIGYKAIQKSYDNEGVRDLTEIQLYEGSIVTELFASNSAAQVTQVKSIYNEQKEKIGYIDTDEEGNECYVLFNQKSATEEHKDFDSHYSERMAQDVLEDWYDLSCSLKYALIDAFTIGDQPLEDAKSALEQFGPALLAWVQRGIDAKLSDYLATQMQSSQAVSSPYYYASRSDMPDFKHYLEQLQKERLGIKKGAAISKATSDQIGGHIDTLNNMAEQHKAMVGQCKDMIDQHKLAMKTITDVADDLSAVIGRTAYAEGADEDEEADAARNGKSNREPRVDNAALTTKQPDNTTVELAQLQAWLEAKNSK